ncbi:MAG: tRNA dihydrouridine synthase DusB [Clostridia bacterium]|nr:tRNA dihydrouridine synthase DusB [Clostridia bacterium]
MDFAGIKVRNNIFLAPMAGVCDRAYREVCMGMGAGLCVSEMVSAKAICYNDKKTESLLAFGESERPFLIQLFGSEPDIIARAINIIETKLSLHPDGYDINMGCPAPKIVSNGEGCALMKEPKLAEKIVRAACAATELPVSVKHRSGWDKEHINAVEFALRMQEAGASFITLHARTRDQFYALRADLELLKKVKDALCVPVAGSGDIFSAKDAAHMLSFTGCDAVMAARGAQGNPWIFRDIISYLESGKEPKRPSMRERMETMIKHAELMCSYKEERAAMREFRKHINWYIKGIKNATVYKNRANTVSSLDGLYSLSADIIASYEDTNTFL